MSDHLQIEQEIESCRTQLPGRTLPTFLTIGAMKCGTSTLHAHLASHPDVFAPQRKEVHFFNQNFLKGLSWYADQFSDAGDRMCFETTPAYLFEPDTQHRIKAALPDAKFIVILRDPVERCVSHYHHMLRTGREKESFDVALSLEMERTRDAYEGVKNRELVHSPQLNWFSYVRRGYYIDQLEAWGQAFPVDRFLVLDFLDLCENPQSVVDTVTNFLGVPGLLIDPVLRENAHPRGTLSSAQKRRLRELYAQSDARLQQFLGRKLSWM
ncbi:sulfotransferase [uncultured Tateyamaria sp.]|uniref:sulfotransferase family protein n=1 Tax=uncultured Tateyamaria sp. TaxID=455651 RepID=UPI00261F7AB7|nr:sulfotransferase [uncultured Tateyamaria sp.]